MNGVVVTKKKCPSKGNGDASPETPMDEREMRMARLRNHRRLSDEQWEKVSTVLPGRVGKRARTGNGREFLEAVLWVAENQTSWLDIPKEFGDPHAVYIRFARWAHDGVWPRVIDELQELPELNLCLSVRVNAYVEARALRRMRSTMKELTPKL